MVKTTLLALAFATTLSAQTMSPPTRDEPVPGYRLSLEQDGDWIAGSLCNENLSAYQFTHIPMSATEIGHLSVQCRNTSSTKTLLLNDF
jgi:heat shock protein HslJ